MYIEGSRVIISKKNTFLSLKIDFVFSTDEMSHHVAFYPKSSLFVKVSFLGFLVFKGVAVQNLKMRIYHICCKWLS